MRVSQDSLDNPGSPQPGIEILHLPPREMSQHENWIHNSSEGHRDTSHMPSQHEQHNEMRNADRIGQWGDDIKPVSDDIVRLIFQNINGDILTQAWYTQRFRKMVFESKDT